MVPENLWLGIRCNAFVRHLEQQGWEPLQVVTEEVMEVTEDRAVSGHAEGSFWTKMFDFQFEVKRGSRDECKLTGEDLSELAFHPLQCHHSKDQIIEQKH